MGGSPLRETPGYRANARSWSRRALTRARQRASGVLPPEVRSTMRPAQGVQQATETPAHASPPINSEKARTA
jgi:hypothetical protein